MGRTIYVPQEQGYTAIFHRPDHQGIHILLQILTQLCDMLFSASTQMMGNIQHLVQGRAMQHLQRHPGPVYFCRVLQDMLLHQSMIIRMQSVKDLLRLVDPGFLFGGKTHSPFMEHKGIASQHMPPAIPGRPAAEIILLPVALAEALHIKQPNLVKAFAFYILAKSHGSGNVHHLSGIQFGKQLVQFGEGPVLRHGVGFAEYGETANGGIG